MSDNLQPIGSHYHCLRAKEKKEYEDIVNSLTDYDKYLLKEFSKITLEQVYKHFSNDDITQEVSLFFYNNFTDELGFPYNGDLLEIYKHFNGTKPKRFFSAKNMERNKAVYEYIKQFDTFGELNKELNRNETKKIINKI